MHVKAMDALMLDIPLVSGLEVVVVVVVVVAVSSTKVNVSLPSSV